MGGNITIDATSYERFRALHERPGAFVMPDAWDSGSALLLRRASFEALGSSSFAIVLALGCPDGAHAVAREDSIANAALLSGPTGPPVNGASPPARPSSASKTSRPNRSRRSIASMLRSPACGPRRWRRVSLGGALCRHAMAGLVAAAEAMAAGDLPAAVRSAVARKSTRRATTGRQSVIRRALRPLRRQRMPSRTAPASFSLA